MELINRLTEIRRYDSILGRKLGPFAHLNDIESGIRQSWSRFIKEVLETPKQESSSKTIVAESAEHAICILKFIQFSCIFCEGVAKSKETMAGPVLFRGMRDDSWNLESSLLRVPFNGRAGAAHLAEAFARLTGDFGNRTLQMQLPPSAYQGVAQHYGFATHLLDFTPDPEVAVFFACKAGATTRGVVYFTGIRNLLKLGCRVLLPPPFFERLVLQRGVFVDAADAVSKDHFSRIVFPSGSPLTVFRDGRGVDLLSEPAWIKRGRAFIEEWAPGKELDSFPNLHETWFDEDREYHLSGGVPQFDGMIELAHWMDHYEDMRYWLAAILSEDEEAFLADVLAAVERDNPELVSLHDQLMTVMGKPTWKSVLHNGQSNNGTLDTSSDDLSS